MNQNTYTIVVLLATIAAVQSQEYPHLDQIKPSTTPSVQEEAVRNLIERVLPDDVNKFHVEVNPHLGPKNRDTFQIVKVEERIKITGSTGVAIATGLNYYLKYFCSSHVSWNVRQINLPVPLPNINITITSNDRFRYYQNVCTTSYSFVWWDWPQWEKHIDWMALNSFNLVLAFNGQEAIWKRVYKKLNLTEAEIDEHFAGPAFLSWSRMGNIRGWGGPLSDAWHERSLYLQAQILIRMRELGMIPVLPAFAGHVPRALRRLYPDGEMDKVVEWNNFNDTYCCPYLLSPNSPMFHTIGGMFLAEVSAGDTYPHDRCRDLNELRQRIVDTCSNMTPEVLNRVRGEFYDRLGYCLFNEGRLFEHLLK